MKPELFELFKKALLNKADNETICALLGFILLCLVFICQSNFLDFNFFVLFKVVVNSSFYFCKNCIFLQKNVRFLRLGIVTVDKDKVESSYAETNPY